MMDGLTPACQRRPTAVRTKRESFPLDCSTPGSQTDTPPTSVGGPLREGVDGRGGRVNVCRTMTFGDQQKSKKDGNISWAVLPVKF